MRSTLALSDLPRRVSLAAAGGALACACVLGLALFATGSIQAWLAAAMFWSAAPIGAVGLLAMLRLIPGRWNAQLSVFVEAGTLLLPLAAVSLLPVLAGIGALYPWTEAPPATGFPEVYLQPWFFVVRAALWIAMLGLLAWVLVGRRVAAKPASAVGLIAYAALGTAIAVDWLMSLAPGFHSSGFGLYVLDIQLTVALLAACLARLLMRNRPPRSGLLGGLVLSAMLLWGYLAFMQYFIIWSGDRPEGARWYLARATGGWEIALWAIVVLHAIPAAMLLSGTVRRHRTWLIVLVSLALGGKLVETNWLVLPAVETPDGWVVILLTLVCHAGLGTLTLAGYLYALRLRITRRLPQRIDAAP